MMRGKRGRKGNKRIQVSVPLSPEHIAALDSSSLGRSAAIRRAIERYYGIKHISYKRQGNYTKGKRGPVKEDKGLLIGMGDIIAPDIKAAEIEDDEPRIKIVYK